MKKMKIIELSETRLTAEIEGSEVNVPSYSIKLDVMQKI